MLVLGLIEAGVFEDAPREEEMERHDHGAEEEDAADEPLEREAELRRHVLACEVANEGPREYLGQVAAGDEEVVAPLRLIEVADVVDEAPKEEENHDAAPQFGDYEEERLDPIPVDGDPVAVLMPQFFEEPIGRCMGGEGIDVGVEGKAVEGHEGHEEENDAVKEDRAAVRVGQFGVDEGGHQSDRQNDPPLQDWDDLRPAPLRCHDERILHGGEDPIGEGDKEFHEKEWEELLKLVLLYRP